MQATEDDQLTTLAADAQVLKAMVVNVHFCQCHCAKTANPRKWSCCGRNCTRSDSYRVGNWHVNCQQSSFLIFRFYCRTKIAAPHNCFSGNLEYSYVQRFLLIMVALWNRADHYIFILWFLLLSSSFPRQISAVADCMSAILPHMVEVWHSP